MNELKNNLLITTFLPYRSTHNQAEEVEYVAAELPLIEDTSLKKPDLIKNDDAEENISTLTAYFKIRSKSQRNMIMNLLSCRCRYTHRMQIPCTVKLSMELPILVRFS